MRQTRELGTMAAAGAQLVAATGGVINAVAAGLRPATLDTGTGS